MTSKFESSDGVTTAWPSTNTLLVVGSYDGLQECPVTTSTFAYRNGRGEWGCAGISPGGITRPAPPREAGPVKIGGIVYVLESPDGLGGRTFGYARVSPGEQKPQLEPQANRLWAYAGQNGIQLAGVTQETASALNDRRPSCFHPHSERNPRGTPRPAGPLRRGNGRCNAASEGRRRRRPKQQQNSARPEGWRPA